MSTGVETGTIRILPGRSKKDVRVIITGDWNPRGIQEKMLLAGRSKELYGDVLPVMHDTDLCVVNVETPFTARSTPIDKSGPNLITHPKAIVGLTALGTDIATLANNHIADHGARPVADTIRLLEKHRIKHVGAGRNLEEAERTLFVKKRGLKIAFLAVAENEFTLAAKDRAGSWPLDPLRNAEQIREAAKNADAVIAIVHGGNEYAPMPSPRIRKTYRGLADAGAAAVICHHPHVPQGLEIYNARPLGSSHARRKVPILYSTGNFLFGAKVPKGKPYHPLWYVGTIPRLHIRKGVVASVELIPIRLDEKTQRLVLCSGRERKEKLAHLARVSRIAVSDGEADRLWDAWCAMMGPNMFNWVNRCPREFRRSASRAEKKCFLAARNMFGCQAHHELMLHYFELSRFGRLPEARKYIPKLKKLMHEA